MNFKRIVFVILTLFFFVPNFAIAKIYKGAEYRTKQDFLYGRFEANYMPPSRDGVLASFFTYFTGNDSVAWTSLKWNEIDVEILGRYNNQVQYNTITPGQTFHIRADHTPFDPTQGFHTYAFEWTPDYVAWFIDGEEVYRQTGSWVQTLEYPQKIMMNIWNPQYPNWVGEWDAGILPAFAYYDWVSYSSYTPGSGNYGSDNNFTFEWKDEFESFDEERWDKATHTFGGNGCDFVQENAVFEDGKLILCLTDEENIGYVDKTPPTILDVRAEQNSIEVYFSEELDSVSATNISNYTIVGVEISKAQISKTKKNVTLTVSDLDTSASYNLIALNIKDDNITPNTMSGKLATFKVSEMLDFPVRINVGGPEVDNFLADQSWANLTNYGRTEGQDREYSASISLTELDQIYRTERDGLTSYLIRVPNGIYNLKLMFAEKVYDQINNRIFDVFVEDSLVADNFEIKQAVPKNAAWDLNIEQLNVSDGILDINFSAEIGEPILSGIVVDQIMTDIRTEESLLKNEFKLIQNYPNPFNGQTKINFITPKSGEISLKIFDVLGKEVYSKYFQKLGSGKHEFIWEAVNNHGLNVNSGVYLVNLIADNISLTKKMIYLK